MLLFLMLLGSVMLAYAEDNEAYQGDFGGALGEWEVQLKKSDHAAASSFNLCIQEKGAWYISSVYKGWKGKYHNPGLPMYLYAVNEAATGTLTFSLIYQRSSKRLSGAYQGDIPGKSGQAVLTFKRPTCSPYLR